MHYMKIKFKKIFYLGISVLILIAVFLSCIMLPPHIKKRQECNSNPPSTEAIIKDLKENSPNRQHPRLMANKQDFERIKEQIKSDKNMNNWYKTLVVESNEIMQEPPVEYNLPDGVHLLEISREVLQRTIRLSLMYKLTDDPKYAKRAWEELNRVADNKQFPNWNPKHFLDTAEMTTAVAIGYDWTYDYLSSKQRETLREAIIENGLRPALKVYRETADADDISTFWKNGNNNWNTVSNAGIALGALAIADESIETEKLAGEILRDSIISIKRSIKQYAPDGGMGEGPGYWNYATTYLAYFLSSFNSALGSDYCLSQMKGLEGTGYYPIYMEGPSGAFNVGDGVIENISNVPQMLWLSKRYKKTEFKRFALKRNDPMNLVWYKKEYNKNDHVKKLPLDKSFIGKDTSLVTMRSDWSKNAVFIGLHGGNNQASHGDLDNGSFVLDAFGIRWASELGADDYNSPGYFDMEHNRWNYYRKRAEGQNTLIINPDMGPDQNVEGTGKIEEFVSQNNQAYSIVNMTNAYKQDAISVKRGIALVNKRRMVVLQDELDLKSLSKVYWFMHTKAHIDISEDQKTAKLTYLGKKLFVHIISPQQGKFFVMPATPLASSPHPYTQSKNEDIKKLAIYLDNTNKTKISVVFTSGVDSEGDVLKKWPYPTDLSKWKNGEIILNPIK